jgi:hypothetical protein
MLDLFRKKWSPKNEKLPDQAVIVELRGAGLPDDVYEKYDLSTLEDQIMGALEGTGLGEFDGNEVGPSGASLYLYGPNADRLFERIENILKNYPLCRSAQVTIRYGPPGAAQRQVTFD